MIRFFADLVFLLMTFFLLEFMGHNISEKYSIIPIIGMGIFIVYVLAFFIPYWAKYDAK